MDMRRVLALLAVLAVAAGCSSGHGSAAAPTTTPSTPATSSATAQGAATEENFPDLTLVRAWLAPTIAQSAHRPQLARAQIVRSTLGAFENLRQTSLSPSTDRTPVYVVQLTGTRFVCPCDSPKRQTGAALQLAWNPAIHYVSSIEAGPPSNLTRIGRVYDLEVGHPTQPVPTGPECGQTRGPVTTITKVERLAHRVEQLPEVFTPPGNATPAVHANDAVRTAGPGFLAARVKATLATMTGPPNAVVPGSRLVWIFSARNVNVAPTIGLPGCGGVAVIVDATTGKQLEGYEGAVAF